MARTRMVSPVVLVPMPGTCPARKEIAWNMMSTASGLEGAGRPSALAIL